MKSFVFPTIDIFLFYQLCNQKFRFHWMKQNNFLKMVILYCNNNIQLIITTFKSFIIDQAYHRIVPELATGFFGTFRNRNFDQLWVLL